MQKIEKISDFSQLLNAMKDLIADWAKIYIPDLKSVDFLEKDVLNKESLHYKTFIELLKTNNIISLTNSVDKELDRESLSKSFILSFIITPGEDRKIEDWKLIKKEEKKKK